MQFVDNHRVVHVIIALITALLTQQAPQRDGARVFGAASISGVVIDAATSSPMARVRVQLGGSNRTTYTSDKGAFVFPQLDAGSYTVSAQAGGYLMSSFGERGPSRPGVAIQLRADERRSDIRLVMHKGGVIGGRITDADGRPAADLRVEPLRMGWRSDGTREFTGGRAAVTDDRGEFRFYGLLPGTYLLAAEPGEIRRNTVQDALTLDGVQPLAASAHVTTFYPGTQSARDASAIVVQADREYTAMDFQLRAAALATIRGRVDGTLLAAPTGRAALANGNSDSGYVQLRSLDDPQGARITAAGTSGSNAYVAPDGRFVFEGVPPGQYEVLYAQSQTGRTGSNGVLVSVDGKDIADVAVNAQPGAIVTGDQAVEGGGALPTAVVLQPLADGRRIIIANPDDQGRFTFKDVPAGRYFIGPLDMPRGWYQRQVSVGGAALPGRGIIDVSGTNISGVRITYRTPVGELSGVVKREDLAPVADYTLIIFPADKSKWPYAAGGSRSVRPDSQGRYSISLGPGDYLLAAVDDVAQNQWMDPEFLQSLIPSAIKIAMGDGQRLTQDLVVK